MGSFQVADSLATAVYNKIKSTICNLIYPVGSIKMTVTNTNPSTYLGGTWSLWGAGRVPVGIDTSQTEFASVEKTGGEKTHKLKVSEMPSHEHGLVNANTGGYSMGFSIQIVRVAVKLTITYNHILHVICGNEQPRKEV